MKTLHLVALYGHCEFCVMASIRVDGHEVPLVFPVDAEGRARESYVACPLQICRIFHLRRRREEVGDG